MIFSYLGSKKALLVLDNCEHLIEARAELAEDGLRGRQAVSIITSREALRIPGEVVRLVPPLSLPDPGHRPTLEELNRTEAARLFYERPRSTWWGRKTPRRSPFSAGGSTAYPSPWSSRRQG